MQYAYIFHIGILHNQHLLDNITSQHLAVWVHKMNSIAVRIGKNIASARKAAGRTQAEVAEKIGIDTVSLSRIERGVVTPGLATLDNLANQLDISLGELFNGATTNTAAMAESIGAELAQLNEEDRLFLMSQIKIWVQRLRQTQRK